MRGKGGAMAPIPHASISAAWCANSTLSRKQQLPTSDAWKHNQRVYIPIVGLENKMSFFAKDSMVELAFIFNFDILLMSFCLCGDGYAVQIASADKQF